MKKKREKKKRIAKTNSKGKTVVHSERYWEDQELERWEQAQILIAAKYTKTHRKKLKRMSKDMALSIPARKEDADVFDGLDVEHLKDWNGEIKYWGNSWDAPKPKRYKNGMRSAEDMILNPGKFPDNRTFNARTIANARMMLKLMRRLGINDKRERIYARYIPPGKTATGDWTLTDSAQSRKFTTKKKAIKAANQPYSILTDFRSTNEYNFKRYRVRIDKDGNKLIKLLSVSTDVVPDKPKLPNPEVCKGCGKPIHPLQPVLVTKWESINGVMRAKSAWCKSCEYIGHKIAKKRRAKKRKIRKLEKKLTEKKLKKGKKKL